MTIPLIPVYLILGFIGFRILLQLYYPVFVFIHEMGHAIPAMLFGAKDISVHIGSIENAKSFRFLNTSFYWNKKQCYAGSTRFKGLSDSHTKLIIIALSAPTISLIITLTGVWLAKTIAVQPWVYFIITPAWLANFHVTFHSLWPFAPKDESVAQSDLAYLRQLLHKS